MMRVRDVARRFVLVYWALYFPVLLLDGLPGCAWILSAYNSLWSAVIVFTTRDLLRSAHSFPDTTELRVDASYGYAHVAIALVLAIAIALGCSLRERSQPAEGARRRLERVDEVVRVLLRYGLVNAM